MQETRWVIKYDFWERKTVRQTVCYLLLPLYINRPVISYIIKYLGKGLKRKVNLGIKNSRGNDRIIQGYLKTISKTFETIPNCSTWKRTNKGIEVTKKIRMWEHPYKSSKTRMQNKSTEKQITLKLEKNRDITHKRKIKESQNMK